MTRAERLPDSKLDEPGKFFYPSNVPNPKKSAVATNTADASLSFEDALKKLESVVEAMESDDLPLETLIQRYEEGMKLSETCQAKLAEAELKISKLEKTASGEFKLKPLAEELE